MNWTNDDLKATNIVDKPDSVTLIGDIIRYVAGCITRERERLARIIESETDPVKIADAIRDHSKDASVFIWKPPTKTLE
jgi:hypothetical protein